MKTISILLIAVLLVLSACNTTTKQSLSPTEKVELAAEVSATVNNMIDGMKKIDIEQAFESKFLLNDDFKYIDIYGKVLTMDEFLKEARGVFDNAEKVDFNFSSPDVRILSQDLAVVTLVYSGKFYFPGSTLAFPECGSTLILNKIDNVWKVIHFHESLQASEFVMTEV
ncbi:nuclear transport factor 2 family protein [uncultured Draconibacterium sp.]|uniref:nuclear transport factor 2 family protein n=1 Tax=uncultured Draconibacterium sp. TaxID=1573823 RepID=UPI0029C776AA|nr:nuclear transport factor 2 family protein [uncultured Draconibacterium sp.]